MLLSENKSRPLLAACLSGVLLFSSPAVVLSADVQTLLNEAQTYLDEGDFKSALIQVKNALKQDPDNGAARLLMGEMYLKAGNGAAAEQEITRARQAGLPREKWVLPLAQAAVMQGRYQQTLKDIHPQAQRKAEDKALALIIRAGAHMGLQQWPEAAEEFEKAIGIAPTDSRPYIGLARLRVKAEDMEGALQQLDRAVKAKADGLAIWLLRGDLERQRQQYDLAYAAYRRADKLQPGNLAVRLGKASTDIATQKWTDAQNEVDAILAESPNAPLANYLQGVLSFRNKDSERAVSALQTALKYAPNDTASHLLIGTVYFGKGDLNLADYHFTQYLAAVPQALPAIKLMAATQIKLKRMDAAVQVLESYQGQRDDAQYLALLGSAYVQSGDLDKGNAYLQQASELAPEMATVKTQLALGQLAAGDSQQAIAALQSAVELGQDLVEADILLALTHMRNQQYDQAIAAAKALLEKRPDSSLAANLLGSAYVAKGDEKTGRESFKKALAINPSFLAAELNLALLDSKSGDIQSAQRRYRRVLALQKANIPAMMGMARIAEGQGNQKSMLNWLERAREADPKDVQPLLSLVNYYLAQNENLQAVNLARELQAVKPDAPVTLRTLGGALMTIKDYSGAATQFERLTELQPSAVSYSLLAEVYAQKSDYDKARKALQQALNLQPDNPQILVGKAKLELTANQPDIALKAAQRIQELYSDSAAGYQLQGQILMKGRQFAEAAEAFAAAVQRQPGSDLVRLQHTALRRAGKQEESIAVLQDWLKKTPDDLQSLMALAVTLQTSDRMDEARSAYEQVMAMVPDNLMVLNNLSWLYTVNGDRRGVALAEQAYELAPDNPEVADTLGWALISSDQELQRGVNLLKQAAAQAPHIGDIRHHLAEGLHKTGQSAEALAILDKLVSSGRKLSDPQAAKRLLAELKK